MLTIGDFNSFWGFLGHPVQDKLFSLNSKSKSGLEKNENNTILLVCLMSSSKSRIRSLLSSAISNPQNQGLDPC